MFSKMFNFHVLKGQLDNVQKFKLFNIFNFVSFLSSAGVLFGLGLLLSTYTIDINQRLMAYIDAVVLTVLCVILAILNSRK
jgi:membrane protein DedA with SNARE-associated domain